MLRRPPHPALGLGLFALVGCYHGNDSAQADGDGSADAGDDDDGESGDDDGADDDGASGCDTQSAAPLRRLSQVQYENALRDLFAPAGIDVPAEIPDDLARIPVDDAIAAVNDASMTFGILDTRVSDLHVRAYYRIASSLSYLAVEDDVRFAAIAGDCALQAQADDACIDAFLDDFGLRAMRRPIDEAEREHFHAIADGAEDGTEAFRGLVFALLMQPQFLYHVETDGEGDDALFDLGPYELASRLSFHFWQTMPDDELLAAAADGSLVTNEGYQAQLDRVFADPRTQITVDRFYDEWLRLGAMTQFPTTPAFQTFAEGTTIGDPEADHLVAAQTEIHELTRHFTWGEDGTLADLFLTDLSFTRSPHLAALYGVEPWSGEGEPPRMPAGERAGLLTRTALLLTGNQETHPVHRGAVVRRRVMCEELPPPDPASLPPGSLDPPPVTDDQTTRERYEAKTADAQCQGCHAAINPVGFVLERYDAIGRLRDQEIVIDEATGEVLASLPIDSSATIQIGGGTATIATGTELSEQVVASGQLEGCFARQYFRATLGREEAEPDACTIDFLTTTIREGSLRDALRAIAEEPVFRSRKVQ